MLVDCAQTLVEPGAHADVCIHLRFHPLQWDKMEKFDDRIRGRRCDNFQFVEAPRGEDLHDPAKLRSFAVGAMQEIPQLWSWLRAHSKFATPAAMERAAALPAPVAAKDYGGF